MSLRPRTPSDNGSSNGGYYSHSPYQLGPMPHNNNNNATIGNTNTNQINNASFGSSRQVVYQQQSPSHHTSNGNAPHAGISPHSHQPYAKPNSFNNSQTGAGSVGQGRFANNGDNNHQAGSNYNPSNTTHHGNTANHSLGSFAGNDFNSNHNNGSFNAYDNCQRQQQHRPPSGTFTTHHPYSRSPNQQHSSGYGDGSFTVTGEYGGSNGQTANGNEIYTSSGGGAHPNSQQQHYGGGAHVKNGGVNLMGMPLSDTPRPNTQYYGNGSLHGSQVDGNGVGMSVSSQNSSKKASRKRRGKDTLDVSYDGDGNSQSGDSINSGADPLPLCTADSNCTLINDRAHQQKFAHTCRLFPCYHGHIKRHARLFRHEAGQIAATTQPTGGKSKVLAIASVNFAAISPDAPNATRVSVGSKDTVYDIFGDWSQVKVHTFKRYLHQVFGVEPKGQTLFVEVGNTNTNTNTGRVPMDDDLETVLHYITKHASVAIVLVDDNSHVSARERQKIREALVDEM